MERGGERRLGAGVETRDWYAWLKPPPPEELHVVGEVYVAALTQPPLHSSAHPTGVPPLHRQQEKHCVDGDAAHSSQWSWSVHGWQ